jgi:cation:H+ antiporter
LVYLLFFQQQAVVEDVVEEKTMSFNKLIMLLILGGFFLWLGSEILVDSAVSLAKSLGVSERIISISVVSIGTSIPELSASIIAIINKEKAISLGNLIGSNIFNILAVMGTTALILPIEVVDKALLEVDFLWMISISLLILPLVFLPKKMRLGRVEGAILLLIYILFLNQMFS